MAESVTDFLTRQGREDILHSDEADEFLAHFGVKGMKWGIRRSPEALSRGQARIAKAQAKVDAKQAKLDKKAGKSGSIRVADTKSLEDGVLDPNLHVSADAERFIKTRMKSGHEMSDREIKEAISRAQNVDTYNKLFSKDPNVELRAKVDAIELQQRFSKAQAELNAKPSRLAKVNRLIDTAGKGFESYSKLNKATGGALNKKVAFQFSPSIEARLAREFASSGHKSATLLGSGSGLSRQASKSLSESAALRKQVDELLKIGTDGTVQKKLF